MKIKLTLLVFLVGLLGVANAKDAINGSVRPSPKVNVSMRDNGYTLGDSIAMHSDVYLGKDWAFDVNSLPLKGPVNNWLDLRDVQFSESKYADGVSKVSIDFVWQIFATVEQAQTLKIPVVQMQALPAGYSTNDQSQGKPMVITIPAQDFKLSPVLPATINESQHRPHAPPLKFDVHTPLLLGILFLSLGLMSGLIWFWLQDRIAWWPRHPGPMTRLARSMKSLQTQRPIPLAFDASQLRQIHAALASSAGESLYLNTLPYLFEKCPYLQLEKEAIDSFFFASWQLFYGIGQAEEVKPISIRETLNWIERAAVAERLFRRQANKYAQKTQGEKNGLAKV
jgi:hypothetical protein